MLVLTLLCLLGPCVFTVNGEPLPLDMATNSIDFIYDTTCVKVMNKMLEIFENELTTITDYKEAWDKANDRKDGSADGLTDDQSRAIYAYTLDRPNVHKNFNMAVRTQKMDYESKFNYKSLHYLLTTAVEILNKKQEKGCQKVYRRTGLHFVQEKVEFRFGSFTSSSYDDYPDEDFGTNSCFEITTCRAAVIEKYSKFNGENGMATEREVLIPPHEIFKVTDIKKKTDKNKLPCDVVFKVESTDRTLWSKFCDVAKSLVSCCT